MPLIVHLEGFVAGVGQPRVIHTPVVSEGKRLATPLRLATPCLGKFKDRIRST